MEIELPEWLDANFLAATLQGDTEGAPGVNVTKFSAALAVAAGNNYMSRLYRVRVEYVEEEEERCTSLIIKAPITKGVLNEMMDQFDIYGKEPKVYKELLPIINSLTSCEFAPKSYVNSVKNVMVLSDLAELGFEMCDRYKQLNFPHCEQVFKKLAKFHAATVVCKRDHPDLIDLVGKESLYVKNDRFESEMKPWIQGSLKIVAGIVAEMKLGKASEDLILSKVENIADSVFSISKPKMTGLNVLNHGDLWVNNMLFKHSSSGNIVDLKFIDFQIVRYASPVLDLLYFIWSSANEDVRGNRLQELCEIYRSTLNVTLEELGCEERMTKEEFLEDMRRAEDWGLVTICNLLPVILCESSDVINMEEVNREDLKGGHDEKFLKLYKGKRFLAMLPKVIEHFQAWVSHYK